MDFLVNEMGYASSSIAESPGILTNSLRERIIPRCSVIKIFVSKGLTEEKISLRSLGKMTYKLFLDKFVIPNEQESPALIKIIDSGEKFYCLHGQTKWLVFWNLKRLFYSHIKWRELWKPMKAII
ncbi:hypothetical protein C5167_044085 [Papaver somniferum]|uniref:Uncharacterized protein n=1 Tax=Papaver somniferum TaxID=3469 RepID=A0A4Y7L945_PAPSO|nr:hypothetical protein C5167_044085 [Papaver somniferum]